VTARPALLWIERGLIVVGLVLLGIWVKTWSESRAYQARESKRFEAELRETDRVGPQAAPPLKLEKGVLGRIEIPRLGISAMVAEGADPALLKRAVGHIPGSALPGHSGNVALAGHRDTFFHGLGDTRVNDLVRFVTLQGTYEYRVDWGAVVAPGRVDVLDSTARPSLTLVTCYPFEAIGPAPQRFVVRARLVAPAVAERQIGNGQDASHRSR
jgi:sortase A